MSEVDGATLRDRLANSLRLSVAAWVAISLACALLIATLSTWIVYNAEPQRVAWGDYIQWPQLFLLTGLGAVICMVAYWTVRLWSEDLPAVEKDLEEAWQAGLEAARKRGCSLVDYPLYLVVGCGDQTMQQEFVRQSKLKVATAAVPHSPLAPLRWFFAEDRVLVFCGDVGVFTACQSRLALHRQQAVSQLEADLAEELESYRVPIGNAKQKTDARFEAGLQSDVAPALSSQRIHLQQKVHAPENEVKTSNADSKNQSTTTHLLETKKEVTSLDSTGSSDGFDDAFETLDATERLVAMWDDDPDRELKTVGHRLRRTEQTNALLTSQEFVHYQSRLADFCQRMKCARRDLVPINGILVWVDAPRLADCVGFSRQCGQALRRDLNQLQAELGVVVPVTFVLDRMQEMAGFSELIRRGGPESALHSIVGEEYPVQRIPDLASVEELCTRSLRNITRKVYRCFQNDGGFVQPGNHKLFQLVLACRGRLFEALQVLVVESIAISPHSSASADANMMSGIFFTASGDKPTQHGFSPLVLQRQTEQQELLCWSSQRTSAERRYQQVVLTLKAICAILAITLLVQLLRRSAG